MRSLPKNRKFKEIKENQRTLKKRKKEDIEKISGGETKRARGGERERAERNTAEGRRQRDGRERLGRKRKKETGEGAGGDTALTLTLAWGGVGWLIEILEILGTRLWKYT